MMVRLIVLTESICLNCVTPVVPRTFTGPFLLSFICQIVTLVVSPILDVHGHPMMVQFLSRFILLLFVLHGWIRLANVVGGWKGHYLLCITACQFHMPFYGSRMLPNTFALVVVLHAYAEWIKGKENNNRVDRAAVLLVTATTVFRCDVILMLFFVGLLWLFRRRLHVLQALHIGILTGSCCLLVTVPLDSHLWRRWLWAEGEVFYYNTVLGQSSNWGTSPWHWYITSALPKSMLLTMLLVPLAVFRIPEMLCHVIEKATTPRPPLLDSSFFEYLLPVLDFVGLYSCLGHKEMRFLFPAMPILNLAAASGLSRLHSLRFPGKEKQSTALRRLMYIAGLGLLCLTFVGSSVFLAISSFNYPGGTALVLLKGHLQKAATHSNNHKPVLVYIDVASGMSGVSLFGQRAASLSEGRDWKFEKAGYEDEHSVTTYQKFTHLLTEEATVPGFHAVAVAQGHPRLDIRNLRIATKDAIFVMERDGWLE